MYVFTVKNMRQHHNLYAKVEFPNDTTVIRELRKQYHDRLWRNLMRDPHICAALMQFSDALEGNEVSTADIHEFVVSLLVYPFSVRLLENV